MAANFWERKFFLKIAKSTWLRNAEGHKISTKTLSRTVKDIETNSFFAIFGKNSKNDRHFWGGENFFENWKEYIVQIP